MWKLNTLLNSQWVKEEIKGEIRNILRQTNMETEHTKPYRMQQQSPKREVYIDKHQGKTISNQQSKFAPQENGKKKNKLRHNSGDRIKQQRPEWKQMKWN